MIRPALLAAVLALSACQMAGQPGIPAAVAPDRAVALLDGICGESLPDFADAPALMQAAGVTRPGAAGDPTLFAATEDAGFRIEDGPGLGRSCVMTVGTDDPAAMVAALQALTAGLQDTAFGPAGLYRGRRALLVIPAPAAPADAAGSRGQVSVRLLSER